MCTVLGKNSCGPVDPITLWSFLEMKKLADLLILVADSSINILSHVMKPKLSVQEAMDWPAQATI